MAVLLDPCWKEAPRAGGAFIFVAGSPAATESFKFGRRFEATFDGDGKSAAGRFRALFTEAAANGCEWPDGTDGDWVVEDVVVTRGDVGF